MTGKKGKNHFDRVKLFLRIAISTILIVYLFRMIDLKAALDILKEASFLYILLAFAAIQITVASSVVKWMLLVHPYRRTYGHDVSIHRLGRLYYVGLFFNNFLPGSVGGDVVRVLSLGKTTGMALAAASVALERLTGGIALVAIVVFSAFYVDHARTYIFSVLAIIVLAIILYFLFKFFVKKGRENLAEKGKIHRQSRFIHSVRKGLFRTGETFLEYRNESWKWWGVVLFLSFLFQIGMAWINYYLFLSFGVQVPLIDLLVIITIISVLTMIPVSLNGIGVREGGYVFFFTKLGVPEEISLSVSLLFLILVTISSLAGGVFWLMERGRKVEALREQSY